MKLKEYLDVNLLCDHVNNRVINMQHRGSLPETREKRWSEMSWSVASFGKPEAVRKDIAEQFTRGSKCVEPEESIRQAAAEILDKAVANQANVYVVKASASGSQGYVDYSSPDKGVYNSLNVQVEVMHGFKE